MAKRLEAMGQPRYAKGFEVTLQPDVLDQPLRWRKPQLIFVNSMSDLFHERVPLEYIERVFTVMGDASQHIFQILTKPVRTAIQELDSIPPGGITVLVEPGAVSAYKLKPMQKATDLRQFFTMSGELAAAIELSFCD